MVAADGSLPATVREDLMLLVTELVTNAVRHAGVGPETIAGPGAPDVARTRAGGGGRSRRRLRSRGSDPASGTQAGGWGLYLVDQIADDWGVDPAEHGTCVWFELKFAA